MSKSDEFYRDHLTPFKPAQWLLTVDDLAIGASLQVQNGSLDTGISTRYIVAQVGISLSRAAKESRL